jgi:hypothetical protein
VKFVRRAIEQKALDPTGFRALTEVLGRDPDDRRADWEQWVLALDAHA